ncbi:MAG: DNA replication protein, partial [Alphaproteobacteria bacterium]|nr:DNA replication protein [Alphaproteobacteria bacterium]
MQQLPLLLEHRRLLGREDFLVSPCNVEAVEWIDLYPDWNNNFAVVILGEKSSGKTHLSWLFSEKTGAKVYDSKEIA